MVKSTRKMQRKRSTLKRSTRRRGMKGGAYFKATPLPKPRVAKPKVPGLPKPPKMPQVGGLDWSRYQAPKEPTSTLGQATYGMRNMFKRAKFAVTPRMNRFGSLFTPKTSNLQKLNGPAPPPAAPSMSP